MCVGQSPRAHPLGSAREKRCGRAFEWHKQQLICPMPNTPEVSGWQSMLRPVSCAGPGQGVKEKVLEFRKGRAWQGKGCAPAWLWSSTRGH